MPAKNAPISKEAPNLSETSANRLHQPTAIKNNNSVNSPNFFISGSKNNVTQNKEAIKNIGKKNTTFIIVKKENPAAS